MKLKPHPKLKILRFMINYDRDVSLFCSLISSGLKTSHTLTSKYLIDLEKRGLIEFFLGDHYRQRKYVKLTDKGREVCASLDTYFKIFEEVVG